VVDVPLERTPEGLLAVTLRMKGGGLSFRFLLDSGASGNSVSPALAHDLALRPHGTAEAVGAGGSMGAEALVELPKLQLGGMDLPAMEASVTPLAGPTDGTVGILGRDFLLLHDTEVDLAHGRLRLFPRGSSRSRSDLSPASTRLPFSESLGLVRVDVRLDGSGAMPAIVDLGAPQSIASVEAAKAAGFAMPVGKTGAAAMGADGKPIAVAPHTFQNLGVGAIAIPSPLLVVGDLPVFGELGFGTGPAVLLGLDMLRSRVVVFDYEHHELVISPLV
jgi:predicted aspartyl protease